ncbi:hypothetical protein BX666DRAFT_1879521 [Dichotomocladium elegans]|nr:hypothetical protein BX666DRAFT_1879521 [Dichotomocladium elegans]
MLSAVFYLTSFILFTLFAASAAAVAEPQITRADILRETIEDFYESVVDEVLSTRTENLLGKLTHSPTGHKFQLLQLQASRLSDEPLHGSCLAKFSGFIGTEVHQQNAHVYDSVHAAVTDALEALWPELDLFKVTEEKDLPLIAKHEVASVLYSLNLAVTHRLTQVYDEFSLLDKLSLDLKACEDEAAKDPVVVVHASSFLDNITNYAQRITVSIAQRIGYQRDTRFVESHLGAVRQELQSELDSRVGDLVISVYNELYDL